MGEQEGVPEYRKNKIPNETKASQSCVGCVA